MTLHDLYQSIANPLDNNSVIDKIIRTYIKAPNCSSDYYSKLVSGVPKQNTGRKNIADEDVFYAKMFNKWKNSIVALTYEEYQQLLQAGSLSPDFKKLRKFLKNVPDVKTKKEANDIFFSERDDKELEEAFKKYRWTSFGEDSGWTHVCSRYLTAKKDPYQKVEGRLYLNVEAPDLYKMITYFSDKCEQRNIPYYFKFDEFAGREDSIVIYSPNEKLLEYIEILNEIKREHPELVSRIGKPPALTGSIDNWIGYGSEPLKKADGKHDSFNRKRADLLFESADKVYKKWLKNNKNTTINIDGKTSSIIDYLTNKSYEIFYTSLVEKYKRQYSYEEKDAKIQNRSFNIQNVEKKIGYNEADLKSEKFKSMIYNNIKQNIDKMYDSFCAKKPRLNDAISVYSPTFIINGRFNAEIKFYRYDFEDILSKLMVEAISINPSLKDEIKQEIMDNSKRYDISKKFCFDMHTISSMKKIEQTMVNQQNQAQNLTNAEQPQIVQPNQVKSQIQPSQIVPPKPITPQIQPSQIVPLKPIQMPLTQNKTVYDMLQSQKYFGPLKDYEIEDALEKGFYKYEPKDDNFAMFLREHGYDPVKLSNEYDNYYKVLNYLKWGPLKDYEIDDALEKGFYEYRPDEDDFAMFLKEHGYDPTKLKYEYLSLVEYVKSQGKTNSPNINSMAQNTLNQIK